MPIIRQIDYARHAGLSRGYVSELVKAGMPLTSVEAADRWRGTTARQRAQEAPIGSQASLEPTRPPEAIDPPSRVHLDEAGVRGAYARQKDVERAAYVLAREAIEGRQHDAGRLVATHAAACRNLIELERGHLELEERSRQLVSGDWVRKIMTEHDGAVASLIRAMPKQLAGRISPHDPDHAERELERWVQEVCLKTLSETDPWR